MEMSVQNGIMPSVAAMAGLTRDGIFSPRRSFLSAPEIFTVYIFMAMTAQKLMRNPEDCGQNGSDTVMTIEARLKADTQSLSAKQHMLMKAALVTESLQPVRQPVRMQNRMWMAKAFRRLTLSALRTAGRHARKPVKCVPDTARRCEQQDIWKSRFTRSGTRDLSPTQTAAANALYVSSNGPDTALRTSLLITKKNLCKIHEIQEGKPALRITSNRSHLITYRIPRDLK